VEREEEIGPHTKFSVNMKIYVLNTIINMIDGAERESSIETYNKNKPTS